MIKRREYYNTARDMARTSRGLQWLMGCLRDPSPAMTFHRIKIICAAIRDIHPKTRF
jgi:hypothetical protein